MSHVRSVATDFDRLRPNSSAAIVGERMSASTRNLDAPLPEKPFSLLSQDPAQLAAKQLNRRKSLGYGNQALRASSIEQGLRALTKQVIERFREVIGCDRATLLYNDANSEELVFFLDEQCIRCVQPSPLFLCAVLPVWGLPLFLCDVPACGDGYGGSVSTAR